MLLMGLVTVVVTALIPIFLWRLGAKQAERDSAMTKRQAETLLRQEQILRHQRRDALLEILDRASDAAHLALLWREVRGYEGSDKDLLTGVFRTNVALALPGTSTGVKVVDDLTGTAVSQYVDGLERRFTERAGGINPYDGLLEFMETATNQGAEFEMSRIVRLVTGPSAEIQRPSHGFFRKLVNAFPSTAGGLLHAVERIDSRSFGGLKLNVLTGTLLAVKDVELGRLGQRSILHSYASTELRDSVPQALAFLLHRDNLRSFSQWSLVGSTEPVSATVAWLVRAVGWLADTDNHLAMRMIENLAAAIESIPDSDRGWGVDDSDVRQGFEWIRQKQPALWDAHGTAIQAAASSIGPWKKDQHHSE